MPQDTSRIDQLLTIGTEAGWIVGVLVGAAVLGLLLASVANRIIRRITPETTDGIPLRQLLHRRVRQPVRLLVPVLFVQAALPTVRDLMSSEAALLLGGLLHVTFVVAATWLLIALMHGAEDVITKRYDTEESDNLKARKIVTQVRILRRIATAILIVLAVAVVLLQYEPVRSFGTGILASAGIAGIVIGVAAQNTLQDLIAGIQIALTQPIRVDDVVIAEGEFGWIEEITLTYVVVRVWDRRRIVMPITHFVNQPFQNWTRTSSDLIGSVFLRVDYRTPIEAVRNELTRIVESSPHWDGEVCALHVTNAEDRSIELRAIASARDAPTLWDLRCEIRESLIQFLQDQYPRSLPVLRARLEEGPRPSNEESEMETQT